MMEPNSDLGLSPLDGSRSSLDLQAERAEFLGLNLDAIRNLATFASLGGGFTIAIAEVGFSTDANWAIDALQQRPECEGIELKILDFSGIEVTSLLPEFTQALSTTSSNESITGHSSVDQPIVFIVRGLETSIGIVRDYPPFLQDLNYVRDVLAQRVPYPIIFMLPQYAAARMARFARDFWSWISLSVVFRSGQQQIEAVQSSNLSVDRLFSSDLKPVKQDRIDQLQRLLDQYAPSAKDDETINADIRLDILLELGAAYWSLADIDRAGRWFQRAVDLAEKSQHPQKKAQGLLGLGKTLCISATNTEALTIFEQALSTYRDVGARLGEANTLKAIGDVQQFLKQSDEALENYQSALTTYRDVGDRLGEANTLKAIGDVQQFLDQRSEALENYQSALTTYRDVGARLGEANTLQAIGDVQQFLKQSDEALENYQSALTTYRDVGARLGEANTLQAIGDVQQFLNQRSEALENYQSALTTYRDVGDRLGEANTLKAIGDVQQFLKQSDEALENYQSALTTYRDVGARLGEANTLKAIGDVQQFLKQSDEALENYQSALSTYRDVGARLGEANTLKAIGDVQQFLKQSDEALENYQSALSTYRQVGDRLGEANTLCELGQLQDDPQQARGYFLEAQALYTAIGDRYSQGRNLLRFIAPVQMQLNQVEEAMSSLDQAEEIGQQINFELVCQVAQQLREQYLQDEAEPKEKTWWGRLLNAISQMFQ